MREELEALKRQIEAVRDRLDVSALEESVRFLESLIEAREAREARYNCNESRSSQKFHSN